MNKKAVSELVAVTLLIAATISVGLIVSSFTRSSAEKVTEHVKMMSNQVECSDVQISIENIDENGLTIKNRGTWGIINVQFRIYSTEVSSKTAKDYSWTKNDQEFKWLTKLMPGEEAKTSDLTNALNRIELIPIINVDDQQVGCEDRIISWEQ